MNSAAPMTLWFGPASNFRTNHTLLNQDVIIGRGEDCNIIINDSLASRKHAQINLKPNSVWITDLGSTNGTRVNNFVIPANTPQQMILGQLISIGSYRLMIEITAPMPGVPVAVIPSPMPAAQPVINNYPMQPIQSMAPPMPPSGASLVGAMVPAYPARLPKAIPNLPVPGNLPLQAGLVLPAIDPARGVRIQYQEQLNALTQELNRWYAVLADGEKKLKSANSQLIISWILFFFLIWTAVLWIGTIIWDIFIYGKKNKAKAQIDDAHRRIDILQYQIQQVNHMVASA